MGRVGEGGKSHPNSMLALSVSWGCPGESMKEGRIKRKTHSRSVRVEGGGKPGGRRESETSRVLGSEG